LWSLNLPYIMVLFFVLIKSGVPLGKLVCILRLYTICQFTETYYV
jgi:hypothetical protein